MQSNAAALSSTEPFAGGLSREGYSYHEHPRPEAIKISAGLGSPNATLMLLADGKQYFYSINRRQMFGIISELYAGLQKMEPGK